MRHYGLARLPVRFASFKATSTFRLHPTKQLGQLIKMSTAIRYSRPVPVNATDVRSMIGPRWSLSPTEKAIQREFQFKTFKKAWVSGPCPHFKRRADGFDTEIHDSRGR
jgi:hypothetical protein